MAPKHRLYSPEVADTILERTEEGEGLAAICKHPGMPSRGAVREWIATDHEGFAARYASARARGMESWADEITEIADQVETDNPADVQKARLQVDSRKWLLSKLMPKTYGDKLELAGEIGIKDQPDDRLQSRLTLLLGTAGIAGYLGGVGAQEAPAEDPDLLPADRPASS